MNVGQWMKSKKMKIPILNDAGNDMDSNDLVERKRSKRDCNGSILLLKQCIFCKKEENDKVKVS